MSRISLSKATKRLFVLLFIISAIVELDAQSLSGFCSEPVAGFPDTPKKDGWVFVSQPTIELNVNGNELFYGRLGVDVKLNKFGKAYKLDNKIYESNYYNYTQRHNTDKPDAAGLAPKGDEISLYGYVSCIFNGRSFKEDFSFRVGDVMSIGGNYYRFYLPFLEEKNSEYMKQLYDKYRDDMACKSCQISISVAEYRNPYAEANIKAKQDAN
jgi:hypothetical protein